MYSKCVLTLPGGFELPVALLKEYSVECNLTEAEVLDPEAMLKRFAEGYLLDLMSEGAIEIDEVALNNLRSEYKQPLSARQTKGPQRPMQKAGAKNGAQKSYNTKNRPNIGPRKNSGENMMRHNSQK